MRGKRRANETAEGILDVSVGPGQGVGLKRGRDGSARIKDLGPPCAGAEEGEGPESILVLADCISNSLGKKMFTPLTISGGGTKEFEVARGVPGRKTGRMNMQGAPRFC